MSRVDEAIRRGLHDGSIVATMSKAARHSSAELLRAFQASFETRSKVDRSIVTSADLTADVAIRRVLQEAKLSLPVFSEEDEKPFGPDESGWIVDPLDGTENFFAGLPSFTTAVGCWHQGAVVAGVIAQPCSASVIVFSESGGVTLNGSEPPLSPVSGELSRVAFGAMYDNRYDAAALKIRQRLYENVWRMIENWCPTLDWWSLALGRIDAVVTLRNANPEQADRLIGKALFRRAHPGGLAQLLEIPLAGTTPTASLLEIAARRRDHADRIQALLMI